MSNGPSIQERQALGNLAQVLTAKNPSAYGSYFMDFFRGWEPIYNSGISDATYYRVLKQFPLNVKRFMVQAVLLSWNNHKDLTTLYESINTLIYLDLCGPAEYYLMQIAYNMIASYGSKLKCLPYIEIQSYRNSEYTLRFWKEQGYMADTYGIVDFQLHSESREPLLVVVPWYGFLREVYKILTNRDFVGATENDICAKMMDLFNKEFAKKHCPWIRSSWGCDYAKEPMNRGMMFYIHPTYLNNNGV